MGCDAHAWRPRTRRPSPCGLRRGLRAQGRFSRQREPPEHISPRWADCANFLSNLRSATQNIGISEDFAQLHRYPPLHPEAACCILWARRKTPFKGGEAGVKKKDKGKKKSGKRAPASGWALTAHDVAADGSERLTHANHHTHTHPPGGITLLMHLKMHRALPHDTHTDSVDTHTRQLKGT